MKHSNIFVTKEELDQVVTAWKCSGMFLPNGTSIGNPEKLVNDLARKYNAPKGYGLNIKTGEFCK